MGFLVPIAALYAGFCLVLLLAVRSHRRRQKHLDAMPDEVYERYRQYEMARQRHSAGGIRIGAAFGQVMRDSERAAEVARRDN